MMKYFRYFLVMLIAVLSACSTNDDNNESEPKILLSDISGVWIEYAYLCSDGYFIDISNNGNVIHYEFAIPDKYIEYVVDKDGNKDIYTQGSWTFDPEKQTAHIEEPKGWNLDIYFDFSTIDNATITVNGRTSNSKTIVKIKRTQQ